MYKSFADNLTEVENEYSSKYDTNYLNSKNPDSISLTLTISEKIYKINTMFSFFDGLIFEGWLLEVAEKNWKNK